MPLNSLAKPSTGTRWAWCALVCALGSTLWGCVAWEPSPSSDGLRAHLLAQHVAYRARAVAALLAAADAPPAPVDWGARYGVAGVALSQRLRVEVGGSEADAFTLTREVRWGEGAARWLTEQASRGEQAPTAAAITSRAGTWWRGDVPIPSGEADLTDALDAWGLLTCAALPAPAPRARQAAAQPAIQGPCAPALRLRAWLAAHDAQARLVEVGAAAPDPVAVTQGQALAWRRLVLDVSWRAGDDGRPQAARVTLSEVYRVSHWAAPLIEPMGDGLGPTLPPAWPSVRRLLGEALGASL